MTISQTTQKSTEHVRIEALKARHSAIETELLNVMKSPSVSETDLQSIKRKKLMLKDAIESEKTKAS